MITGKVKTEKVQQRLAEISPKLQAAIFDNVERILIRMQNTIKVSKLSGQVLNRITGVLSRSINYSREMIQGGVRAKVFAGVVYAKYHEYGGRWFIPQHERLSKKGIIFTVKGHYRDFKERSFLRTTLAQYQPEYIKFLRAMIKQVA